MSKKNKVLIIAEAGVNHNGSLRIAKQLVRKAKEVGADVVKFQAFKTENLVSPKAKKAQYQKKNFAGGGDTQYEMLKKMEFGRVDFIKLKKYCEKIGIKFLVTPFDEESADMLEEIGLKFFKIPSGEITNLPFLKHIARKGKPLIMSTGMANMNEIKEALKAIYVTGNKAVTVLHCTTEYPAPFQDVNLKAMQTMGKELRVPVGYSDHTSGIGVAIAAVALGAVVIEKHFTLDRTMEGPDHKASLEPEELKAMVSAIRNVEKALGHAEKKPAASERRNMAIARKSVVAVRNIKKGAMITKKDVGIKRPGNGIAPKDLKKVLGRKAKKNIEKGDSIKWRMFK